VALRITFRASCSYESDSVQVQTYRSEIVAPNARRAASRLLFEARRAYPGSRPRSIVLVLEEISRGSVPGVKRKKKVVAA